MIAGTADCRQARAAPRLEISMCRRSSHATPVPSPERGHGQSDEFTADSSPAPQKPWTTRNAGKLRTLDGYHCIVSSRSGPDAPFGTSWETCRRPSPKSLQVHSVEVPRGMEYYAPIFLIHFGDELPPAPNALLPVYWGDGVRGSIRDGLTATHSIGI